MTRTGEKERNPVRTREAILDAAEQLFAERGYGATSLNDVGAVAGVSRGTPGYFFGSKQQLYRDVLERCLERVRTAVRSGRERALASREPPEVVLAGAVGEYFDFIHANPSFVRLLEREALDGGRQMLEVPPHLEAAQEALGAIMSELALEPADQAEASQLLISMLALSWFHVVHGPTVLRALGVDANSPEFLSERRRHIVSLVVQASEAGSAPPSPRTPRMRPDAVTPFSGSRSHDQRPRSRTQDPARRGSTRHRG